MKLRVIPWWTDAAVKFMTNLFKWYPAAAGETLSVLEWGGGNSTIYFLQNGCQVLCVESHPGFADSLAALAGQGGYSVLTVSSLEELTEAALAKTDLIILLADSYGDIGSAIFSLRNWSIVVNDGISRTEVLKGFLASKLDAILLLDNLEYCANWGHLARSSGKREQAEVFRSIVRDDHWNHYLFEQQEGRDGHCVADVAGFETPNRSITGFIWSREHQLHQFMVTDIGWPLVNESGLGDADLNDVEERCPYDFEAEKWLVDEYPAALDMKLTRRYD